MSSGAQPPRSHTSTTQWQSFEMRMRRRRAARYRLRAWVAIDAGFPDDARAALEEARVLEPDARELEEIEARLGAPEGSPNPGLAAGFNAAAAVWPRAFAALALVAALLVAILSMTRMPGWEPVHTQQSGRGDSVPSIAPMATAATTGLQEAAPAERVVVQVEREGASEIREEPVVPRPAPEKPDERRLTQEERKAPQPKPLPEAPAREPARILSAAAATAAPPTVAAMQPLTAFASPAAAPAPEPVRDSGPAAAPPAIAEEPRVRSVLSRYEAAYSELNAAAARAVWPTVNGEALSRAFAGLESQEVSLGNCDIAVSATTARADCAGRATWTPKVGGGTRSEARQWTFELARAGDEWRIVHAVTR